MPSFCPLSLSLSLWFRLPPVLSLSVCVCMCMCVCGPPTLKSPSQGTTIFLCCFLWASYRLNYDAGTIASHAKAVGVPIDQPHSLIITTGQWHRQPPAVVRFWALSPARQGRHTHTLSLSPSPSTLRLSVGDAIACVMARARGLRVPAIYHCSSPSQVGSRRRRLRNKLRTSSSFWAWDSTSS